MRNDEYEAEEYPYDLDESNFDESLRCPECGLKLRKDYILDSAYGTTIRIPTYICDNCE